MAADGGVFTHGDAGFFGSEATTHLNAPVLGIAATPDGKGYWLVAADGGVFTHGDAGFFGSEGATHLNAPCWGWRPPPTGRATGWWGLTAGCSPTATPGSSDRWRHRPQRPGGGDGSHADGKGYWLVGADGGMFTHGDAGFFGSEGATDLNAPVLGMAATPDGKGYWLVGADGGVFTHGDAPFLGSLGSTRLNAPVRTIVASG